MFLFPSVDRQIFLQVLLAQLSVRPSVHSMSLLSDIQFVTIDIRIRFTIRMKHYYYLFDIYSIAYEFIYRSLAWLGVAQPGDCWNCVVCGAAAGVVLTRVCAVLIGSIFYNIFSITIHKRVFITIFFMLKVCKNQLYNNHIVGMKRSRRRRWNELDKQKYRFFKEPRSSGVLLATTFINLYVVLSSYVTIFIGLQQKPSICCILASLLES